VAAPVGYPPYDALLFVSFGGPEGMDDVMPFLENVLRGRNVPRERMLEVAHHYELFNGVSPLNAQNRQLIAELREELNDHGINLPIYWGNRNWNPLLSDTMRQMKSDGIKHTLAFFTSAYSSYSGCRQYREDLQCAIDEVGEGAPEISLLRKFYNHPGFIKANASYVKASIDQIPEDLRAKAAVTFTAHSIPLTMAQNSHYVAQLTESCQLVMDELGGSHLWRLVYQSRSGPPSQPWLEPDIGEHLRLLCVEGTKAVVISPIGFISDHIEVKFDLDIEAQSICDEIGLTMIRAQTAGTHPSFIAMIGELIRERLDYRTPRRFLGSYGPSHDVCPINCCQLGIQSKTAQSSSKK
jgi:ferrochelatase